MTEPPQDHSHEPRHEPAAGPTRGESGGRDDGRFGGWEGARSGGEYRGQPWWHGADEPPQGDVLGSAAEEAARLFAAIRDRVLTDPSAARAGMRVLDAFVALRGGTPAGFGEAPECAYCPVCQAMARAKTVSPDTVERLTAAAMEFAETVRQIVVSPAGQPDDGLHHVRLDDDFEEFGDPGDRDRFDGHPGPHDREQGGE